MERDVVYETNCRDECNGPRSSTLSDTCVPMSAMINITHEESPTFKYLVAGLGTVMHYHLPFLTLTLTISVI